MTIQMNHSSNFVRLFLVSFFISLNTIVVADTNLDEGIAAFESKQYDKALCILNELSLQGDARAQYYVAMIYNRGKVIEKDLAKSQHWLAVSANNGNVKAQFVLARSYEQGRGRSVDRKQALYWYKQAASQGHVQARLYGIRLAEQLGDGDSMRELQKFISQAQRTPFEAHALVAKQSLVSGLTN